MIFMKHAIFLLILLISLIGSYINSFNGVFQLDDYNVIVYNTVVHSWAAWLHDLGHGIRPFLKLTYVLNRTSGMELFGFHLFNIVVHAINTVFIYILTLLALKNDTQLRFDVQKHAAFLTALIFALHPVQTEAVTYISGRSASLMTMLYLGSLISYIKGAQESKRIFLYLVSPFLYFLGIATKEVAIILPAALLLWEITINRRKTSLRTILKNQAVHWILLAAFLLILFSNNHYRLLIHYSFNLRSFQENLMSQINGINYLLSHIVVLNDLNIDPELPVLTTWSLTLVLETMVLLAPFIVGLISLKKYPWLLFCVLWFFLHTMLIPLIIPRIDIINDRHFYQGSWGIFMIFSILLVFLSVEALKKATLIWGFALCIALLLGAFTIDRNQVYRSEIALWEDTVIKSPSKPGCYNNLGYAYYLNVRYAEARESYTHALVLDPDFLLARNNLNMLVKP
jgi:protein O-mannosyl-transferase